MFVTTPDEIRAMDKRAVEVFGIPGLILMENAAIQVANFLMQQYSLTSRDKVLILAGTGNNGGDGFAVARQLHLLGIKAHVLILNPDRRLITGDAATNLEILSALKVTCDVVSTPLEVSKLAAKLQASTLVLDAVFGTGITRLVDGIYQTAIVAVNQGCAPVVSVDIPSGINGSTGEILGVAIKASHTITFGFMKRGHLLYPGREYTGQLHVVPISLPGDSPQALDIRTFSLNYDEMVERLKLRPLDGYKGTFGKVAVVAGSIGLTGAASLTALAALKSGAGLVTLGVPTSLNLVLESKLTEVMTHPLYDGGTGFLQPECIVDIDKMLENSDVLAIGPGLGNKSEIIQILRNIFGKKHISIVVDADGLNHISKDINLLRAHSEPVIITPHPGEMSRLIGKSINEILKDPVGIASEFARVHQVIVLLKGAASVVADPKGQVYINSTGNSGMATAGAGDVLTGMIASLLAQGYTPFDAAVNGCYIHGRAGDEVALTVGETGMLAGDLLEALPQCFKNLYKSRLKIKMESKETITKRI